jgi:hypothetical protein
MSARPSASSWAESVWPGSYQRKVHTSDDRLRDDPRGKRGGELAGRDRLPNEVLDGLELVLGQVDDRLQLALPDAVEPGQILMDPAFPAT